MLNKPAVVAIVGPTGSGKSALADWLLTQFPAEIINADARQIYRGLTVLSAAPISSVPGHLYQFLSVNQPYSFAQYVIEAGRAITTVSAAGRCPLLVGGTGLYVDALLHGFASPPEIDQEVRRQVRELTPKEAVDKLLLLDSGIQASIDLRNPRRVARALEVILQTGSSITTFWGKNNSSYHYLKIGWTCPWSELKKRIAERVILMWQTGAVEEVQKLLAAGLSLSAPGRQTIGVSEIAEFLSGDLSVVAAQQKIIQRTQQYARRQLTWWRRDPEVVWYTERDLVCRSIQNFLPTVFKM